MKKLLFIGVLLLLTGCKEDRLGYDGKIAKIDGKYYLLECRMGNAYILKDIDTMYTK